MGLCKLFGPFDYHLNSVSCLYIYIYINVLIYKYIRRPLFRRCHQAAKEQSSQKFNSYLPESQVKQSWDESSLNQAVVRLIVGPRTGKSTLHLGHPLDPWIPVKQCSRPDGSAIQPILASPGQSRSQAQPLASSRASNMRSKATPSSHNGPQKKPK